MNGSRHQRPGAAGGAAGAGAAGGATETGDPGAEGTGSVSAIFGGAARPRPYYVPLLQQVLGSPPSSGPPPFLSSPPIQPASPLPGPSPYSGPVRGLTERREPESRPVSPESRSASPVRLLALVVFRVRVLLLSLALTLRLCVFPLLRSVSLCRLLLCPLFLPVRTQSLTPYVLLVQLSRISSTACC
ncbi:unnamed protein product [Closterium sp. NIES-53]